MDNLYELGSTSLPEDRPQPEPERIRPARCISDAKRRAALKLFKSGLGYKAVATTLNLSANTVRDWGRAFKRGTFEAKVAKNQYRYQAHTKRHVISLRAAGVSWKKIEASTGVKVSTCRAWVAAAEAAKARNDEWP